MTINLTPQAALRIIGGLAVVQLVLALSIEKYMIDPDKALFLLDIVSRNVEHLEEFDLIALRELGLIKPISEAS